MVIRYEIAIMILRLVNFIFIRESLNLNKLESEPLILNITPRLPSLCHGCN